jgi:hypothetical protein
MKKTQEELQTQIQDAISGNKIITLKTLRLSDYGEMALMQVIQTLLTSFQRKDLVDVVYPAVKELVVNATKANLKRVIFEEKGVDADFVGGKEEVMNVFRSLLTEEGIQSYETKLRNRNLYVSATFYYNPDVLHVKVKNPFPLSSVDEQRIRDRFRIASSYQSLQDFYMDHVDNTEGQGLGLTMVCILLEQSGMDRHSFTVHTKKPYDETAARLEIPLSEHYESRRSRFERELVQSGKTREEFRDVFIPDNYHR